jgi:phage tail tape-measure protein
MMASDDKDTQRQGQFGLGGAAAGAATGALIGSVVPVIGTLIGGLIGAGLGAAAGQYAGAKEFGGGMDGGRPYLVGENGPEIVSTKSNSTVSANKNLESTFNTKGLENKMSSMISELNSANKTLTSMVNGVNTLVAVESRALKAVETSARKDVNQVGMV